MWTAIQSKFYILHPLLTVGFQYMGDQFIVDLHELLVDLLVIFGILVPDQRVDDLKVDHHYFHLLITFAASAQAFKAALKSLCR